MAPEVRYGGTYDSAVDIYSLGVTLYILLCGFPPVFSGNDSDEVTFPVSYWNDISEEAKDLVRKMVNPVVEERITAVDALSHVWIVRSTDNVHKNEDDAERLNRVRQRLYKSLGAPKIVAASPKRKRCSDERQSPCKRRHERRASVTLIALADLCRSSSSLAPTSSSPKRTERKASLTGSTVTALSF
jgi:serine/threonine protein kinase